MSIPALLVCLALSSDATMSSEDLIENRSELINRIFNQFNKEAMHLLDDFYSNDVEFEDPINHLNGLDELRAYYASMYENVTSISFDFTDEVISGDIHVVVWTMKTTAKKLNKGKPVIVHGNSVIKFGKDNKVFYHRDYFDMGEMIYQHVPVLRYLVKKVNKKLENKKAIMKSTQKTKPE